MFFYLGKLDIEIKAIDHNREDIEVNLGVLLLTKEAAADARIICK